MDTIKILKDCGGGCDDDIDKDNNGGHNGEDGRFDHVDLDEAVVLESLQVFLQM